MLKAFSNASINPISIAENTSISSTHKSRISSIKNNTMKMKTKTNNYYSGRSFINKANLTIMNSNKKS